MLKFALSVGTKPRVSESKENLICFAEREWFRKTNPLTLKAFCKVLTCKFAKIFYKGPEQLMLILCIYVTRQCLVGMNVYSRRGNIVSSMFIL